MADPQSSNGMIIGKSGSYHYAMIPIAEGESLVFGRDAALSSIIIDRAAEKVSRRHCAVEFLGLEEGFRVTDYSRNGTFVDDSFRLESNVPTVISCGSSIALGSSSNSFILVGLSVGLTDRGGQPILWTSA
jgi:predicted component of type VI protein secretion system